MAMATDYQSPLGQGYERRHIHDGELSPECKRAQLCLDVPALKLQKLVAFP